MTTSGVSLVESVRVAGEITSVSTWTSVNYTNESFMHLSKRLSLFSIVDWSEARANLAFISALNSLKALSKLEFCLCLSEIWGDNLTWWWSDSLCCSFDLYGLFSWIYKNWAVLWWGPKLLKRIVISVVWTTALGLKCFWTRIHLPELFKWIVISIIWTCLLALNL